MDWKALVLTAAVVLTWALGMALWLARGERAAGRDTGSRRFWMGLIAATAVAWLIGLSIR